ncbi:hypothetical protein [Phocaeicola sp.]|uniref:hypothetical protein n=1 Tax=Phocaeicola sp. TaxID=2773926 RepID=UPI0026091429|nr:hypothetical protein [Phocaeicola sp.]
MNSEQSGIELTIIHKFEKETTGYISLSTFIVSLKVIGQTSTIDYILPKLTESPYLMHKDEKKAQRTRHTK